MRDFLGRGGVSFHSVGYARGPGRLTRAIEDALRSPLVADYDIYRAKCVVLFIQYSEQSVAGNGEPQEGLKMDELSEVNRFYDSFSNEIDFYWGLAPDETLGEYVSATIFAGGFSLEDISGMREHIDATTTARDLVRAREEAIRERRRAEFYGSQRPFPPALSSPRRLHLPTRRPRQPRKSFRMVESSPTGRRSPELHAQTCADRSSPLPNHPPPIRNNLTNMSDNASHPNEKKHFEPLVEITPTKKPRSPRSHHQSHRCRWRRRKRR